MKIQIETIPATDLLKAFDLLKQLRPHLSFQELITTYKLAQQANQYTLTGAYDNYTLIGLMGYRILYDYVHGKHLYIDDMVVCAQHRSRGIGAQLLQYAEERSIQLDCNGLRLSTGIANADGIKFYQNANWELKAYTFKKGF